MPDNDNELNHFTLMMSVACAVQVNLTFDPVPFEDVALGVKVHRGVYQTAMALYERFLPLVMEHLASSPFAKISFTVRLPHILSFRRLPQTF